MGRFPEWFSAWKAEGSRKRGQTGLPATGYTESCEWKELQKLNKLNKLNNPDKPSREAGYPMRSTKP